MKCQLGLSEQKAVEQRPKNFKTMSAEGKLNGSLWKLTFVKDVERRGEEGLEVYDSLRRTTARLFVRNGYLVISPAEREYYLIDVEEAADDWLKLQAMILTPMIVG